MSVTLLQGDCLDLLPTLEAGSVDAIVTDPPFKLSQTYTANVDADNLLAVSSLWGVAREMLRIVKPGGLCALFYDNRILPMAMRAMENGGWRYLRTVTFYRRWGQASMLNGWMSTSDLILIYACPGVKPKFHGAPRHDVYIKAHPEIESTGHPAQKPIECLTHLIENITPLGGTVLDPYMGSGSTGVAAMPGGYGFIGIERQPEYYEIAAARIAAAQAAYQPPLLEAIA